MWYGPEKGTQGQRNKGVRAYRIYLDVTTALYPDSTIPFSRYPTTPLPRYPLTPLPLYPLNL